MNIKKLFGVLLSASFLLAQLPVLAEEEVQTGPEPIFVEVEKAEIIEGGFKIKENKAYSGGAGMYLYQTKEETSSFTITFTVEQEAEYDLQLLSTSGAVSHLSTFTWQLDDGKEQSYGGVPGESAGYVMDPYTQAVNWMKLKTLTLTPGEHTFTVKAEKFRSLAADFMYAYVDCLWLVPSAWNWYPYQLSEPYNIDFMKFEPAGGSINKTNANPKQVITATVQNQLVEKTPYNAVLYTEIRNRGERVVGTSHLPAIGTGKWKVGKIYKDTCNLTIPANAPDGIYEVWSGFKKIYYTNGESMQKIGEFTVGEGLKYPDPAVIELSAFAIPETVTRHEPFVVNVEYTGNKKNAGTTAYLAFYQGEELWYVAEGKEKNSVNPTLKTEKEFTFEITESVPDGEYSVEFGLHGYNTVGEKAPVVISGGELAQYTHKPMSYGKYIPNKTGNCHFWYANQNMALIWDGAPYIPIGGMVCSNYVIQYRPENEEANKAKWAEDVALYETFKEKGLEHIYINTNRTLGMDNGNTAAWMFDDYYELMESYDIKYGWQINSPYRETEYYSVRAATSQIKTEATEFGTVTTLGYAPNGTITASECLYVVIDKITGEAVDQGKGQAEPEAGQMRYTAEITVPKSGSYEVYFTPWARFSSGLMPDPFVNREETRRLYRMYGENFAAGDNFRNFIDPMVNESQYFNWGEPARHTGGNHHEVYTDWLKKKYSSLDELAEAWQMLDMPESFDVAADLVPVYTTPAGTDETMFVIDINTQQLYRASARGMLWEDYIEFREWAFLDLNNDIADCLTATPNSDVPVVYKQVGLLCPYFTNDRTFGGFDGIGAEVYGNFARSDAVRSYQYSDAAQSKKTMWFVVTETSTEENMNWKTENGPVVYESKQYMHDYFDEHFDGGVKGIYDFVAFGNFFGTLPVYSYHSKPEAYDWSREYKEKTEKDSWRIANTPRENGAPLHYFYPGPSGWWFPPNKHSAAGYHDDVVHTRMTNWENTIVIPTYDPTVDKSTLFVNMFDAPATTRYGKALNEYLENKPEHEKVVFLGLRKDLGALPLIDRYYTEETFSDGENTYQALKPTETSEVFYTTDGKVWGLRDGNIYILAIENFLLDYCSIDVGKNNADDAAGQYTSLNHELINGMGLKTGAISGGKQEIKAAFSDISEHWAKADIEALYHEGVVAGRSQGIYAPDEAVTRAELLQLAFASIRMNTYVYNNCYRDVTANDWYANVMQTANESKLISGEMLSGENILPNQPITREETASILSKLCIAAGKTGIGEIGTFADAQAVSQWARADLQNAIAQGIILGDDKNCLNPQSTLTRAEAAAMIRRFMSVYLEK